MINYLEKENPSQTQISDIFTYTSSEISGQPELWLETLNHFVEQKNELKTFLDNAYSYKDLNIILTGAGTSAFIGEVLEGPFQQNTGNCTRAIATTDLVSHPRLFFQSDVPTLLISFARSGDSPESIAAVKLCSTICQNVFHLIITCNPLGKLAMTESKHPHLVFLLPHESNDKGLAMTGSFTSMLLVGLLTSNLQKPDIRNLESQVLYLSEYAKNILQKYAVSLKEVAKLPFERAVFLGSGPLLGVAKESHLKLQELTDGRVICKFDSYLGFRHGPKSIINDKTLLVYLFSNCPYSQQYEFDLVRQINAGHKGLYSIGISETNQGNCQTDLKIQMGSDEKKTNEEFLAVCSVLPAQILGYYKSLELGLNPDEPSVNGSISRVVKGVEIYPYA